MLAGSVGGRAEIRHVQGLLATSPAELNRRLLANTRKATRPIKPDIIAATGRLPSGYAPTMARSVRVATRVTAGSAIRVKVSVSAKGKREDRDVRRVDRGVLRHPLFGMRKHWFTTTVRPRFVADPLERFADRVADGARDAADGVADRIVRG